MIKAIRGTRDILFEQNRLRQWIEQHARSLFNAHNFDEIVTPIFESTELFERGVGTSTDIIQKEMYTFMDKGNRSLTLRPEGTACVVRSCIENHLLQSINKLFYIGPFFRFERPQAGRYRQFYQIGVEVLGNPHPLLDAEIISLAYLLFTRLNLTGLDITLNTIGDPDCRPAMLQIISDFFQPYLQDLSAHANDLLTHNPLRLLDSKDPVIKRILESFPGFSSVLNKESIAHFEHMKQYLDSINIPYKVDPLLVRGLDYYTHTTFEISSHQLGAQSAICGGGRYNQLVKRLGGPDTPSIGFAFGLDRLVDILSQSDVSSVIPREPLFVFAALGDRAQRLVFLLIFQCRQSGLRCDALSHCDKLTKHLQFAHKKHAKAVVIIGEDELHSDEFVIRFMDSGEQETHSMKKVIEYLNNVSR